MARTVRSPQSRFRGIALILTLFTVAILVTLSTAFAILSFNESRSSRSDKDGKLAYEFAVAGVDSVVSYMGGNINWHEDNVTPDPVVGQPPSFQLVGASPVGQFSPWPGILYTNPNAAGSPVSVPVAFATSNLPGPTGVTNSTFTWTVQFNGGGTFPVDNDHDGTISMVMQRAGLAGDPDSNAQAGVRGGDLSGNTAEVYIMQSTATIVAKGSSNPLATRTVVARVRQVSSTDNSLLIQASKFFDVPGLAKDYVGLKNSGDQQLINANFQNLENIGGIPFDAQIQGQITVLNAPTTSAFQTNGQAGVLDLFGNSGDFSSANISSGKVTRFDANVSLGQGTNGIQFGDLGSQPAGLQGTVFAGGDTTSQGDELPGSLSGQNAATQFHNGALVPGTLASSPMITIDSSNASSFGTVVPLASGSPASSAPIGKDIEVATDSSGNLINGAPPGIANVKITLNAPSNGDGGSITIQKTGAYSGAPVPFDANDFPGLNVGTSGSSGTVTISVNQLEQSNGGLLYVDGGNVQVDTNGQQDIAGRLSIVAGGSSQRPTVDDTDPTNPSLVAYASGSTTNDGVTGKSIFLDPSNSNFTPGGAGQPAVFPFKDAEGRYHWPSYDPDAFFNATGTPSGTQLQQSYANGNSTLLSDIIQHDDVTTREGNLTVTSSIVAQTGQQPSLALMAENYVLLSDQTNPANNTLNVDATLQSFAHSVQWAGFLNSVNITSKTTSDANYFVGMASGQVGTRPNAGTYGIPAAPNASLKFTTEAAAGHFNLTGSIISPFIDVEGTFDEGPPGSFIGYPNQSTRLDVHAQDDPPPFLPNFNHDVQQNQANGFNVMSYRIESITDLGAPSGK